MFSHIFPASETKTGRAELVQPVCEPYLLTHDDAKTFVDVTSPARDPTKPVCTGQKSSYGPVGYSLYQFVLGIEKKKRGIL